MILDRNNYREIITSYSYKEWQPLFDLIPEIEKTKKFGEIVEGKMTADGDRILPRMNPNEIVYLFSDIVYKMPIIIDFDWPSWDEGRSMVRDENFDLDTVDIPTKCKLITAIVRNDRFCDGALVDAFESGFILKILKSIRENI